MTIFCHLAQYRPDQEVLLRIENATAGRLTVSVRNKGRSILERTLELAHGNQAHALGCFSEGGYEVELGGILAAFDVSSDPNRYLRYGFLCDFQPSDRDDSSDVNQLLRYRINAVQFYDWMYRHHEFLPPTEIFTDAMGRSVDLGAVKVKLRQCTERGQRTLAYGAVYGAEIEYIENRPEQRLYRADGTPLVFIGIIAFCNPQTGSPWSANIVEQYRRTVVELGFDGIHMDQYGYPKIAFDHLGQPVDLESAFVDLIDVTKTTLSAAKGDNTVIFNAVGDWPTTKVAGAPADALYIEVWDPHSTYSHLMALVRKARSLASNKSVILAAYLHCFNEGGAESAKLWAALTTSAFIGSVGGTHLLWGETNGALAEGYYVNHGRYEAAWEPLIRAYCEFPVKYRDWIVAPAQEVSFDRMGGPNREFLISGHSVVPDASTPGLTATLRRQQGALVVQLLQAPNDLHWNTPTPEPQLMENLELRVMLDKPPVHIWTASPDFENGRLSALQAEVEPDEHGTAWVVILPKHRLWSLVVFEW